MRCKGQVSVLKAGRRSSTAINDLSRGQTSTKKKTTAIHQVNAIKPNYTLKLLITKPSNRGSEFGLINLQSFGQREEQMEERHPHH